MNRVPDPRARSRSAKAFDVKHWADEVAFWVLGGTAVALIALAGALKRAYLRVERAPKPPAPKHPVTAIRKALDRYGR